MPARFVSTSLVTKRAGIAARFVTLVTKRAVVTKRAATNHSNSSVMSKIGHGQRICIKRVKLSRDYYYHKEFERPHVKLLKRIRRSKQTQVIVLNERVELQQWGNHQYYRAQLKGYGFLTMMGTL